MWCLKVSKAEMKSNLVYLRPLRVAYMRSTGDYAHSSGEAWERMFHWLAHNGLNTYPGCGYGLYLDDPATVAGPDCRYEACIEMSTLPEHRAQGSLQVRKLPGGAYVRERYIGCYSTMGEKALKVRRGWSSTGGLALDERRPVVQIFLDDPRRNVAAELRSDVCMPVFAEVIPPRLAQARTAD